MSGRSSSLSWHELSLIVSGSPASQSPSNASQYSTAHRSTQTAPDNPSSQPQDMQEEDSSQGDITDSSNSASTTRPSSLEWDFVQLSSDQPDRPSYVLFRTRGVTVTDAETEEESDEVIYEVQIDVNRRTGQRQSITFVSGPEPSQIETPIPGTEIDGLTTCFNLEPSCGKEIRVYL
ncbi:uncharacterized protein L203_102598 [Cryptococcus depauperatus CBS 7841]|uniref:Uncharacterized protein n=1 Tax=Cryptococcus depauperatus CBS 7841 TaxID=1295531 RepID=A0AAJ8M0U5_9TREE